jgi:uncharacterized protein with GYD domain
MRNIKDTPTRLEAAKQAMRDAGGRMIFWYMTLGEYDFISVAELPDAETGTGILLALGAQGNVRTTTMRAFTEDEAAAIVESLP